MKTKYEQICDQIYALRKEMRDLAHEREIEAFKLVREFELAEGDYERQLVQFRDYYIFAHQKAPEYFVVDEWVYGDLFGKGITEIDGVKILCREAGWVFK